MVLLNETIDQGLTDLLEVLEMYINGGDALIELIDGR